MNESKFDYSFTRIDLVVLLLLLFGIIFCVFPKDFSPPKKHAYIIARINPKPLFDDEEVIEEVIYISEEGEYSSPEHEALLRELSNEVSTIHNPRKPCTASSSKKQL